jgi:hypothetical protein
MLPLLPLSLVLVASVAGTPLLVKRDDVTSVVNLANNTGTPGHLASGFIYGIPDTPDRKYTSTRICPSR